jgi:hypothetical protein
LKMFWKKWEMYPWAPFTSPWVKWESQPTFVVGEYLFIVLSIVAFIHALRQPGKFHLLVWVTSIVSGCANDVFFMALPFVDNFWHAQATIMITPRLPLYIPLLYNVFMYYSTVSVWRLHWRNGKSIHGALAEGMLTGLVAILIYEPFDIIGAKFLWWTWHDTDAAVRERILGVPIGSTMWVITFSCCYSWILGWAIQNRQHSFAAAQLFPPSSSSSSSSSSSPSVSSKSSGGARQDKVKVTNRNGNPETQKKTNQTATSSQSDQKSRAKGGREGEREGGRDLSWGEWGVAVGLSAGLTTPGMMAAMAAFSTAGQQGLPGVPALLFCLAVFGAVVGSFVLLGSGWDSCSLLVATRRYVCVWLCVFVSLFIHSVCFC